MANLGMDNLILKDVGEVYIQDLSNPMNIYFLGMNEKVDLNGKISTNTILKSRIGDLPTALIQGGKEFDFTVQPVMYSESIFGILNGTNATNGATTVTSWEDIVITGGTGTLQGTPASGTTSAVAFDAKGNQSTVTISGQTATLTTNVPTDGTTVKIVYPINVTGNIMDLNAANFPKAFKVFYHNVFFNPDTNAIYADLYITFNKGVPDGSISASFGQSKQVVDPIKFILLTLAGSTSFGTYVTVPRTGVLTAPIVTPQSSAVHGTVITLTYPDNPVWRSSISDLKVDGTSAIGSFTTLPSMIKLASSLTPTAKTYTILIKATNYPDQTITQVTT